MYVKRCVDVVVLKIRSVIPGANKASNSCKAPKNVVSSIGLQRSIMNPLLGSINGGCVLKFSLVSAEIGTESQARVKYTISILSGTY